MANRFPLWGQAGWASAEVVGETHYAKAIRALFGGDFDPRGTDLTIPVQLVPDRNNKHDRNAVGVWSGSSLLGHLPRSEAARYVGVLTDLITRGLTPEVNARITGREWGAADGRPAAFDSTIRLDLAEPHMLVPANPAPIQEHRLLPSGSAAQVVGQQQFLDALVPLLRPEGECWAYVTLHEMADHLVEVRIGDARVGDLSPKMSGELLPALRHMAEQGLVTAARAIVRGNSGKSEVMLYVARAQDLPDSWQGTARRPGAGAPAGGAPGRGTASVPSSGVAATGPVTPGPGPLPATPAPAIPGINASGAPAPGAPMSGGPGSGAPMSGGPGSGGAMSGGPGSGGALPGGPGSGGLMSGGPASGGLVPNWVSGDSLPSWAAPASTNPAITPAPAASPVPPSSPVSPAAPFPSNTGSFPSGATGSIPSSATGSFPSNAAGSSSFLSTFASSLGPGASSSPPGTSSPSSPGAPSSSSSGSPSAASSGSPSAASPGSQSAADQFPGQSGSGAFSAGSGAFEAGGRSGAGSPGPDSPAPGWAAGGDGRLGWSTSGDTTPSWVTPSENPPILAPAGENPPSWATTGESSPSWANAGDEANRRVPSWSTASGAVPNVPSAGGGVTNVPSAGGAVPNVLSAGGGVPNVLSSGSLPGRHSATTPVPQMEGPGGLLTHPLDRPVSPPAPTGPGSPAPAVGDDYAIAETTVIPALAAVVKANSGALAGLAPVSGVPEPANPHPPIPPAPTGIRFVVPSGWPTPPSGWYPPEGWRPDPSWPPAPADWQFWVPTWD